MQSLRALQPARPVVLRRLHSPRALCQALPGRTRPLSGELVKFATTYSFQAAQPVHGIRYQIQDLQVLLQDS